MTTIMKRLLRTLANKTRNTARMIKSACKFNTCSVVFGKDSFSSYNTQVAKTAMPKSWSQSEGRIHSQESRVGKREER
jgi:hypothetical protein